MEKDTFITLAIHTYEKAVVLRQMLENNGIEVRLQNVNLKVPEVFAGVRVRINEKDLPLALKIIERAQQYSPAMVEGELDGISGVVLIPVDFSENSMMACRIGFSFAAMLSMRPLLIHAYTTPYFRGSFAFPDQFDSDMMESQLDFDLEKQCRKQMDSLVSRLKDQIKNGKLPDVDFSTDVVEGVPEEVILEYSRTTPPALIVMATRGKSKREEDMIGSVTAEVIDSCRVPVFTVPENCGVASDFSDLANVVFFCNLNQQDMLSMDAFVRLFNYRKFNVNIVPVNDRVRNDALEKTSVLTNYFSSRYPELKFSATEFPLKSFREEFEQYVEERGIRMLVVPNKKKSVFSRLFNPGIAHRILFEKDIPMLVLPV